VPSGTSFANAALSKISAVSATDIWAVGTTTAIQGTSVVRFTLAMHYNGTAWSIVKTANTAEPTGLSDVTAISATNAWAVGTGFNNVHDTSASVANKAVIEHWNGTAWSIVASPAGLISVDQDQRGQCHRHLGQRTGPPADHRRRPGARCPDPALERHRLVRAAGPHRIGPRHGSDRTIGAALR
jgi:hypothetical protein